MLSIAAHHSVSSEGFKFFFFFVSTLLRGFAFTLIDREQGGAGRGVDVQRSRPGWLVAAGSGAVYLTVT
jgi:hypothetical protein